MSALSPAPSSAERPIFARALSGVRRTFQFRRDHAPTAAPPPPTPLAERVAECLSAQGGEAAARARVEALGQDYLRWSDAEKIELLLLLHDRFGYDLEQLASAAEAFATAKTPAEQERSLASLRRTVQPPRLQLFRRFSGLPDGLRFLVDLREDVMRLRSRYPEIGVLDVELRELLDTWFDVGLLRLRVVDWNTSAAFLEKLVEYEAVHPVEDWQDLKRRVGRDRRIFAFVHPALPDEPLIFVEVALVQGLATNIQELLDTRAPVLDPATADTAIFYSISNAHRGLAGISFGNFLLKDVVKALSAELPNLKTFATLSPMPGFRAWLEGLADDKDGVAQVKSVLGDQVDAAQAARRAKAEEPIGDEQLSKLAAYYTARARSGRGRAADSVAHFHLGNGARVEQINLRADLSETGVQQSLGVMVNYRYVPTELDANVDTYRAGEPAATSLPVRRLLK